MLATVRRCVMRAVWSSACVVLVVGALCGLAASSASAQVLTAPDGTTYDVAAMNAWFAGEGALDDDDVADSYVDAPVYTNGTDQAWVVNGTSIVSLTHTMSPQQKDDAMLASGYCNILTTQKWKKLYNKTMSMDASGWFAAYLECMNGPAAFQWKEIHIETQEMTSVSFTVSKGITILFDALKNQSQGTNVFTSNMWEIFSAVIESLPDGENNATKELFDYNWSNRYNSSVLFNECDVGYGGDQTTYCTNHMFVLETPNLYTVKLLWLACTVNLDSSFDFRWTQVNQNDWVWNPNNTQTRQQLGTQLANHYNKVREVILDD